ncbi:LysR substrate-binding domain-containing protein [Pseudomonas aeruginosa]|uniref:LysR family transcriptional regulator n=1 Tax=Gammaproteobacteria TaxID=1236 RepID=UPI00071B7973|nr:MULTISPECIES: LysR family transcriptional regulator [Gammaproteobacteria]EMC2288977.1 LysR family transcriptional regulator [Salmonella enterica]HEM6677854.1 LysR family transcriptional regulator [Citrobacter amalonaticus]KSQ25163.1 LysR family transcriptional regulator [Pseudomonas aeruginosa]MCQ4322155.1 LysR substrate-binding domain-containing protein [Stutzerimonas stutzeri]MCY0067430.1 LysR family transcriptional regulator [Klebsiella pneumoniae]
MIETRLLHQFIAVAEELHFNRAAERLHMAQPPLSQAIRRLEQEIGAPLFERTNRSVSLTPAGAAFLESARKVLRLLDESVGQTRRVAQGIEGHLTLTFINIAPYSALLRALRRFRSAFPAVSFTMQEATTQEQVEALEHGRADLGFMRPPGRTAPGLRFASILREPIVVALPARHRLAGSKTISLAALQDDAFVSSPRHLGQGFHDQLVQLCEAAGFVPRIAQQARQLQTLVALVAGGFGVALLPASLVQDGRKDVAFRPIKVDAPDALRHVELLMAWSEHAPCVIRDRLIDEVRDAMASASTIETI